MILLLTIVLTYIGMLMTPKFISSLILALFLAQMPNQDWNPVLWILPSGCARTHCSLMRARLVMITPSQQAGKVHIELVQVGGCDIKPTSSARNLGATFDQHTTLKLTYLPLSNLATGSSKT